MKFLIIIPAHNEEENIGYCLTSLENQSFKNFELIIVNDGSTDRTERIAAEFSERNSNFELLNLEKSDHQPGAKVVATFNKGLQQKNLDDFDIVCKFDADIIFPKDYLEKINSVYVKNPKAGMVSGLVKINNINFESTSAFDFEDINERWYFENLSSKEHVRGPIKSYRKECFKDMKGLRPVLGWDNIDVMLSKMHHWEVITIKKLWVKHLRPTAFKYKNQKAEKLGEYFYNIGLSFILAAISSIKSSWKSKSFKEFFITMKSFLRQDSKRNLSDEEVKFIRRLRWDNLIKNLL